MNSFNKIVKTITENIETVEGDNDGFETIGQESGPIDVDPILDKLAACRSAIQKLRNGVSEDISDELEKIQDELDSIQDRIADLF